MATPNLDEMSLEQLTEILNSQVSELTKIDAEIKYLQQMENQMAEQPTQTPAAMEAAAPAPMEAAAPAMPPQPAPPAMDEFGMGLTPEMIQQATAKLVEAGMFEMTTSEMSNELIGDLQVIADLLFPGLYVLSQPDQLMEFLNGIINGTIELRIPAGAAGATGATGASPVGAAGAVPAGAGAAGAGAIPAGAGAAPAPIL